MGAFIQSSQALARGVIPRVFAKKYWGTAHCISVSAQGSAAGEKQMATHTTQPAADSSHLCSSTRSSSRAREQQLTAAEHHHHARCTAAFFCCFFLSKLRDSRQQRAVIFNSQFNLKRILISLSFLRFAADGGRGSRLLAA